MQWIARRRRPQHELPLVADQAHQPQPPGTALPRRPLSRSRTCRPSIRSPAPATGATRSASETHTCPLAMEFYSANEFWVKAGSLMSTDPTGRFDLPDHPLTRNYLLSSKQHGGAGNPASKGLCQQFLIRSTPRRCSGRCGSISTNGRRAACQPPASQVPQLRDQHAGAATAAVVGWLPEHSGRHLYRPEDDALSVQLWAEFLQDLRADDKPAGHSRRTMRTIRPTARSIRATCRRPTTTATTLPAFGCRN